MSFTHWMRNLKSQGGVRPMRQRLSTRKRLTVELLEDRLCMSAIAIDTPLTPPDAATQARANAAYGQLPLSFEANQGQVDPQVNFLSRGSGYMLFLTPSEAVLELNQRSSEDVLRMQLVGANSMARVVGLEVQAGKSNYLIGNDPGQWYTNIANYGRVEFQKVYSGIDIVYYGNQRQLEYDFIVAPGANPNDIQLSFQGAENLSLDSQGNLLVHTAGGDIVEQAPLVYQQIGNNRQGVSGHYVLERNGQVGFAVGAYDPSRPLVIDPVYSLVYSTYLGGSAGDAGYAIAVDAAGDAYVTGNTFSSGFGTKNSFQPHYGGSSDVFVTKLNPAGTGLVYSTYLGGSGGEVGAGIAVNSAGNAFVTGYTDSANFPTKNGFQATNGGGRDAFVAELNATGSALVYSTYLGGSGSERFTSGAQSGGVALDRAGNAYVTGYTESTNFPVTPGAFRVTLAGYGDAFVTKINPSQVGSASLVYSTYLGGSNQDVGYSIAVDGVGDAYVTGSTISIDFPTTPGAYQSIMPGADATFVTKLDPTGSALVYSTLLSGFNVTRGYGIALNSSGNAYVTGQTDSPDFPTTPGAYQRTFNAFNYTEAFVTEFNLDGSALVYSTFLGGSNYDWGQGIAVDGAGSAYVTGITRSTDFPTANAVQSTYGGGSSDAFLAKVDPSQSGAASLVYSTYLGGNSLDEGHGIAVDGIGNAYVTGITYGTFPTTAGAFKTRNSGNEPDAFVTKIDPPAAPARSAPSGITTAAAGISVPTMLPMATPSVASDQLPNESLRMLQLGSPPVMLPLAAPSVASGQLPNEPPQVSQSVRTAQSVAPTPAAHPSLWDKPMTSPTALADDVFAREDWLAEAVVGDLAFAWIR
jgi:hypothetical protein